jgi:hypothetical protein
MIIFATRPKKRSHRKARLLYKHGKTLESNSNINRIFFICKGKGHPITGHQRTRGEVQV